MHPFTTVVKAIKNDEGKALDKFSFIDYNAFTTVVKGGNLVKANGGAFFKEQERLITSLSKLPVVDGCEWKRNNNDGFEADLNFVDGASIQLVVLVLTRAYPSVLANAIKRKAEVSINGDTSYIIIMAPFISEESAKLCEKMNVGYMDMSGNCRLCVHSLFVSDQGHPNQFKKNAVVKTIFDPTSKVSSMILRAIMCDVSRHWKLSFLSEELKCSIGQVAKVKNYLCEQLWAEMRTDGLTILDAEAIMRAWSESYGRKETGDEILDCYTLQSIPSFENNLRDIRERQGIDCYLTGFSGGVRYAPVVRYNKAHVIVHQADVKELILATECKPVESGANVQVRVIVSEELLYDAREINGFQVVSPVQVFLDCMKLKGRGAEMADTVLTKEIEK